MARGSAGESLLSRVMRILEAFGPEQRVLAVSDIAALTGLPLSTAHRLVREMVEHRILERDPAGGIRMGTRMWEMGSLSSRVGLREAAGPVLESLQGVVRQHVQLAVLVDDEVLYIERLSARGAVTNVAKIATRLPTYACSAGLVLLAFGPEALQEKALSGPFVHYTPHSIQDAARLRRVIAQTKRMGYSVASGLITPGSKGIAAPVRDSRGDVIAALSVVVSEDADHRSLIPMLKAGSRAISHAMGAQKLSDDEVVRFRNHLPR